MREDVLGEKISEALGTGCKGVGRREKRQARKGKRQAVYRFSI